MSAAVPKVSAGLVMYRVQAGKVEMLLVHPGGPFWAKKDEGAWFIPKGEIAAGEEALATAKREFEEETGIRRAGNFISLGSIRHKSGKVVHAWAFEGSCDPSAVRSNTFSIEWPPRSGKKREFPEVDRAGWFTLEAARSKIQRDEFELLERLQERLGTAPQEKN